MVRFLFHTEAVESSHDRPYPNSEYLEWGCEEQLSRPGAATAESGFEMKQSTMPDAVADPYTLFAHERPTLVVDEANSTDGVNKDAVTEHTLKTIAGLEVPMSSKFEDQWNTKYMARIFPWALKFDCGGADYPDMFSKWAEHDPGIRSGRAINIQDRWRRIAGQAALLPGPYAQMLATRAEMQLGGDWMLVLGARNLHWRYAVLRNSFIECKKKLAPGESVHENLIQLIEAAKSVWERLNKPSVIIDKKKRPMNGDIAMLFKARLVSFL